MIGATGVPWRYADCQSAALLEYSSNFIIKTISPPSTVSLSAHRSIQAPERKPPPGEWSKLPAFRQLLLLRALRPDRITNGLTAFCEAAMGSRYINQDAFSAHAVVSESTRQEI